MTETKRILLVDDDMDIALVTKRLLESKGYEVHLAHDGKEALVKAKSSLPDLMLLDGMMPEMDGYEAHRRLREDPGTQDLPVIFFSAMAPESDKLLGQGTGTTDFLAKPFTRHQLLKAVGKALRGSEG